MLSIGILGLGKIADRVAKGIEYAKNGELVAVSSRNIDKAKAFAYKYHADIFYDNYMDMLQDDRVDIIYICTPNILHKEHIMLALKYHKHVICEKPMVLNLEDLDECFAYAKRQNCFLMEAHKTVFTTLNAYLLEQINKGVIGKIHFIEAQYASNVLPAQKQISSWHYAKEGGGCLYDIGVYPIAYANYFAQSKINDHYVMEHKIDGIYCDKGQAMITYDNGIMAHIVTSWQCDMINIGYIYGELGYIECHNFWKSTQAFLVLNGKKVLIEKKMESDFTPEIEHAINCIESGKLESDIMGYQQSYDILKIIA